MNRFVARLKRDRQGAVAIEFAAVATVLALLFVGIIDFGLAYVRSAQMVNAVRAGTQVGLVTSASENAQSPNNAQIRQAVVAATPFPIADPMTQVTVAPFCECADGTQVASCSSDVGSVCTGLGGGRGAFLAVTLTAPYDFMLGYPGLGNRMTLQRSHIIQLSLD